MNKRHLSVFAVAAAALFLTLISSAFAELADNKKNPGQESESDTLRKLAWEVSSDSSPKVRVVDVGASRIIPVKDGLTLVWVNESTTATDFGAYNKLFLVYHSKAEMPHYTATFFLGQVFSVESVKVLNDDSIQIDIDLHEKLGMAGPKDRNKLVSPSRVRMTVDLSELNAAMKTEPEQEGDLGVSVKVLVSETLKE